MKKDKVNVLHIITGLGKGGAERVVLDLCKYINRNDYNVFVFAFGLKSDLLPMFKSENIHVKFKQANNFYDIFFVILSLRKFLKRNKIDLIHSHLYHALVISFFINVLSLFKYKVIFTSHSINLQSKFREFVLWCLKPFRLLDIIFSVRQIKYYEKRKVEVIPNGIDTILYDLNLTKIQKFTFLSIGRLEYVKNHIALLDAVKSIKNNLDFEVWIIGEGHLFQELKEKIIHENLSQIIKLKGYKSDIINICNISHCFLMHSLWEGLPIALIEAGASGLPVICTPVGSIPDLISNETGYLSSIDNFGIVMSHVISNYEEAKKKGENLKKLIKSQYDINNMVRKHELLYDKVMSQ